MSLDLINIKQNEIINLPKGINISTMCASCKLGSNINISNIEKYLPLSLDDILCVKLNKEKIRSLIPIITKNKRIKKKDTPEKKTNHFYNQITVVIRIGENKPILDWKKEPKINLKLFQNGSIQMSGCKTVDGINIVLNKLIDKLSTIKARLVDNKIENILFVENKEKIKINNFKIDMVNSNYRVDLLIDRAKLFNLLMKKKIKSSFEPCIRACVNIKYVPTEENIDEKEISIFVFQKGNIIITGARNKKHILLAYKYINDILLTHYDDININEVDTENDEILKLYEEIMKDVELGLIKIN